MKVIPPSPLQKPNNPLKQWFLVDYFIRHAVLFKSDKFSTSPIYQTKSLPKNASNDSQSIGFSSLAL
jgi:hypothetical protein